VNAKERLGVDFTNRLQAAFVRTDHKCSKKTVKSSVFFMLLGSAHIKVLSKMSMKLTPEVDFTNNLLATFTLKDPKSVKRQL